ncbi:hypothetical protein HPL003_25935 [Paenibacillus terrae HPL-003]|uniref:Uncharacterized protein n=1 Tax=Paenibacillus terrae (strain HPL-003) TaxID=985665 RepID=G7VQS3_PAETH|nr:hypothetical protein HPL003_25935 [Paenibacillus terrae HPL-003]
MPNFFEGYWISSIKGSLFRHNDLFFLLYKVFIPKQKNLPDLWQVWL